MVRSGGPPRSQAPCPDRSAESLSVPLAQAKGAFPQWGDQPADKHMGCGMGVVITEPCRVQRGLPGGARAGWEWLGRTYLVPLDMAGTKTGRSQHSSEPVLGGVADNTSAHLTRATGRGGTLLEGQRGMRAMGEKCS